MNYKKLFLYYQTLKYVKFTQLYHQIYYRLKNRLVNKKYNQDSPVVSALKLENGIKYSDSYLGRNQFQFLNLEKEFTFIDWNFSNYGKLWTYNLNYFEFLNQEQITTVQGLDLIKDFISKREDLKDGLEPYPLSLRGINWIKFLSGKKINDQDINTVLYQDYLRLNNNLEYHLLANHLLENGISLLFGSYYLKNEEIYAKAKQILSAQLKEQILQDGAHYELSPMYHQIILHRVLDCLNLVQNNTWKNNELQSLLTSTAEKMTAWLQNISFNNGEIPYLNDAAPGIAPSAAELVAYAHRMGLNIPKLKLKDSGYRRFNFIDLEVIMDVGQIAPSYQPGHSHADNLQFVFNYKDKPILVDTGISTYEKNTRRQVERSTSSHNTVTINDQNSSKVWDGFRVAERATTTIIKETESYVEASHDGFRKLGLIHKRIFLSTEKGLKIKDVIEGRKKEYHSSGYLHFHPDINLKLLDRQLSIDNNLKLEIADAEIIELEEYEFAEAYNTLKKAKRLVYHFKNDCTLNFTTLKA